MKCLYYNEAYFHPGDPHPAKVFEVIVDHKDGTVDIGTGGTVVVRLAPVSDIPRIGHVTLVPEVKPKATS